MYMHDLTYLKLVSTIRNYVYRSPDNLELSCYTINSTDSDTYIVSSFFLLARHTTPWQQQDTVKNINAVLWQRSKF